MTKVIFRKFKEGDVIAIFPEIPAHCDGFYCQSYQHIGQHGAASPYLSASTKPATPEEYAPLLQELQEIGYDDLKIVRLFTRKDYEARKAEIAKI